MDNTAVLTLKHLVNRLEHTLLSPAADSRLRHSKFERARVSANLDHAKTLLLTLDKQSAGLRVHSQQQQIQADLSKRRDAIKRLSARLAELNQAGDEEGTDSSEDEAVNEQDEGKQNGTSQPTMREFAPARAGVDSGISLGDTDAVETQQPPPEQLPQLRSRRPLQASDNRSAASTTARDQLFAGRKQHPDLETTEALMTHNREEQEALSNGLLGLARALKESSLNFASSLEAEKEVLSHTEGSLDKSAQGMDQAEKKMGLLRRMSEGQGWFGRLKLYGFIAGLWLACFLLVFLGPKLRF